MSKTPASQRSCLFVLCLLALLFSPFFAVAETANVQTYDQLVHAIRSARAASVARVEAAAQQEKVRECWEIGKLIDEHVLQHKERADYDRQVIPRLAKDLGTSESELYRMLKFARVYPILATSQELSWSDYRELLSVNNPEECQKLIQKAEKEKWTVKQVREEVRRVNAKLNVGEDPRQESGQAQGPAPIIQATPGKPYTYRIVPGLQPDKVVIDLGFSIYYTPPEISLQKFKAGDIVEIIPLPQGEGRVREIQKSSRLASDLYTYTATVTEVIDGDTVWAVLDLGFGMQIKLRLRLNHIDAPEILTAEGKESKAFLEKMLSKEQRAESRGPSEKQKRTVSQLHALCPMLDQELPPRQLRPLPYRFVGR